MKIKRKIPRYAAIAGLVAGLLGLYYLNNTYVINFFDNDFPFFIKRFKSREIYLLDRPDSVKVIGTVRIASVLFFGLAISMFHFFLIRVLFSRKAGLLFLLLVLGTGGLSGILYVLFRFFPSEGNLYYLSRVLKDFLLSPLFPGIFALLYRFIPSTREISD